ncbi:hypothetical protein NEOLI_000198 [Neolecta irregularis DAH-3]|uniref:Uncharacterized protein n=1 Tax=Neolecta irregularis (strain DAH-3) TaxID=1198029 RepID=A0A1U7LK16_NEOID|nr:hypothetical protein NEOLI_000198 [Neolecta irregularis DAH-3]|eukprot:OLL22892.1 hypothetical protein NEOLI_000198 [Neolecta irregularis DAH-3]
MALQDYFGGLVRRSAASSSLQIASTTSVLLKRASSSVAPGSSQDCGDVCVYPTDHNGLGANVTIALCACLPLVVAVVVLIILHRRHINRLRLEDLNDKNDERDYGNNYPMKAGLKRTETEKSTFPGPMFDDPQVGSAGLVPYLNAPEMTRSSAHSLARTIASTEDRYRLQTHIPKSSHGEPLTPSNRSDGSSLHDYNHQSYGHYEEPYITRKPLLHSQPGSRMSYASARRPDEYSPSLSGRYVPPVDPNNRHLHNITPGYYQQNDHHDHVYGSPHQQYQDMYEGHTENLEMPPYPTDYDSHFSPRQDHNRPQHYIEEDPIDLQAPRHHPGIRRSLSVPSREMSNRSPLGHALPVPLVGGDQEDEKAQRVKSIYREYFDDLDVPESRPPMVPQVPSQFNNASQPNRPLPRPHQPGPRAIISPSNPNPNHTGPPPQARLVSPQARKPVQPLKPLNVLPTPHKMENDPEPIGFAPPRRRQPSDNTENKSTAPTPAMVLSPSYASLSDLPSPSGLRKSSTFTTLDFAPKPRFLTQDVAGDNDSIRSARTNTSLAAIQHGAGKLSNVPSQLVSSKDRLREQLKPSWDLRKSIVTNSQQEIPSNRP